MLEQKIDTERTIDTKKSVGKAFNTKLEQFLRMDEDVTETLPEKTVKLSINRIRRKKVKDSNSSKLLKSLDRKETDLEECAFNTFLQEFDSVKKGFGDKKIKVKKAIGETVVTEAECDGILKEIEKQEEYRNRQFVNKNFDNKTFKLNNSFPVYDIKVETKTFKPEVRQSKIDVSERFCVQKLKKIVDRFIVKQRLERRLDKLKQFSSFAVQFLNDKNKIESELDNNVCEQAQVNFRKKFDFSDDMLGCHPFPSHNHSVIKKHELKIEDSPMDFTDELLPVQEILRNDLEIEYYEQLNPFKGLIYQPVIANFQFKKGAEEECREETGFKKLTNNELEDDSEAILFEELIPEDHDPNETVFDPSQIKMYAPVFDVTESMYNRHFSFKTMPFSDPYTMNMFKNIESFRREFLSTSNGYNFLRQFMGKRLEKFHLHLTKQNKSSDAMDMSNLAEELSQYIKKIDEEDERYLNNFIKELENKETDKEEEGAVADKKKADKKGNKNDKKQSIIKTEGGVFFEEETDINKEEILTSFKKILEGVSEGIRSQKFSNIGEIATYLSDINQYVDSPYMKAII